MSGVTLAEGRITFHGPPGATAFVDLDWLPPDEGDVPAIVAHRGEIGTTWAPARWPAPDDPEHVAAAALCEVADAAVRATVGRANVRVAGSGAIARRVRSLVRAHDDQEPDTIVAAVGDAARLRAALDGLPMLGLLVVAGEGPEWVDLDLYPEAHVRGLRIVGIAPPFTDGLPSVDPSARDTLGRLAVMPTGAAPDAAAGACWLRIDA